MSINVLSTQNKLYLDAYQSIIPRLNYLELVIIMIFSYASILLKNIQLKIPCFEGLQFLRHHASDHFYIHGRMEVGYKRKTCA